ncbi:MAG: S41 family peptidase [Defluviitaleaceae bacterium]|nr:S41 family peptidase [Defluviitaleaceae bacterium]
MKKPLKIVVVLAGIVLVVMVFVLWFFLGTQGARYTTLHSIVLSEEVRELVYKNRSIAFPAFADNFSETIRGFLTPELNPQTDAHVAERISYYRNGANYYLAKLTHAEIRYELDFLFELLRYGYGAYQYFGGDAVFCALRESMLVRLEYMDDPLCINVYRDGLLLPALRSVIVDNHFRVGEHSVGARSQFFLDDRFIIRRVDSLYIINIEGEAYVVHEVRNSDWQIIYGILPTITQEGEFAWAFGYVLYGLCRSEEALPFEISALLENVNTGDSRVFASVLPPISNAFVSHEEIFSISVHYGVAVLQNRRFFEIPGDRSIRGFPHTGRRLRHEPILILDLRGHSGGNDLYGLQWMGQYAGQRPNSSMMFANAGLYTRTVSELSPWMQSDSPPHWEIRDYDVAPAIIQNNNLLIVLTDSFIGSSGDAFVGFLRQLENVLIVGTNTSGTLLTGNVGSAVLPSSRFEIAFGTTLSIRPDLSPFEGVGFMPDLWVPPNESLERVLKMIELKQE